MHLFRFCGIIITLVLSLTSCLDDNNSVAPEWRDSNGLDREGYDRNGYKEGFDRKGFDIFGCNKEGLDQVGVACSTKDELSERRLSPKDVDDLRSQLHGKDASLMRQADAHAFVAHERDGARRERDDARRDYERVTDENELNYALLVAEQNRSDGLDDDYQNLDNAHRDLNDDYQDLDGNHRNLIAAHQQLSTVHMDVTAERAELRTVVTQKETNESFLQGRVEMLQYLSDVLEDDLEQASDRVTHYRHKSATKKLMNRALLNEHMQLLDEHESVRTSLRTREEKLVAKNLRINKLQDELNDVITGRNAALALGQHGQQISEGLRNTLAELRDAFTELARDKDAGEAALLAEAARMRKMHEDRVSLINDAFVAEIAALKGRLEDKSAALDEAKKEQRELLSARGVLVEQFNDAVAENELLQQRLTDAQAANTIIVGEKNSLETELAGVKKTLVGVKEKFSSHRLKHASYVKNAVKASVAATRNHAEAVKLLERDHQSARAQHKQSLVDEQAKSLATKTALEERIQILNAEHAASSANIHAANSTTCDNLASAMAERSAELARSNTALMDATTALKEKQDILDAVGDKLSPIFASTQTKFYRELFHDEEIKNNEANLARCVGTLVDNLLAATREAASSNAKVRSNKSQNDSFSGDDDNNELPIEPEKKKGRPGFKNSFVGGTPEKKKGRRPFKNTYVGDSPEKKKGRRPFNNSYVGDSPEKRKPGLKELEADDDDFANEAP